MSKSKGNTVDPQALIDEYGADTVRLFTMFAAPPEQSLEWSDSGVEGAYRFLKRLWHLGFDRQQSIQHCNRKGLLVNHDSLAPTEKDLRREIHEILQQALNDFDRYQFNTVVSACMKILNSLSRLQLSDLNDGTACINHEAFSIMLKLLSPITPHICMSLWQQLEYGDDILRAQWPTVDAQALVKNSVDLAVQVNGKVRATITVNANADKKTIEEVALANENVIRNIDGKAVTKVIVIPEKLVSIVAK